MVYCPMDILDMQTIFTITSTDVHIRWRTIWILRPMYLCFIFTYVDCIFTYVSCNINQMEAHMLPNVTCVSNDMQYA